MGGCNIQFGGFTDKNIGIFVKEKAHHGIDATALNELVISLRKSSTSIFIEKGSGYKNEHLVELNYEEFVLKTDLIIVFGGDGTLLSACDKQNPYPYLLLPPTHVSIHSLPL